MDLLYYLTKIDINQPTNSKNQNDCITNFSTIYSSPNFVCTFFGKKQTTFGLDKHNWISDTPIYLPNYSH